MDYCVKMATKISITLLRAQKFHQTVFQKQFTSGIVVFSQQNPTKPPVFNSPPISSATSIKENVPGLSEAVHTMEEPVGPGAAKSGEYKVPEYFNYNKNSYYEAEIEMERFRCPQPIALNM